METQTKRNWKMVNHSTHDDEVIIEILDDKDNVVCEMNGYIEEKEVKDVIADAELIVLAPEMAEALIGIADCYTAAFDSVQKEKFMKAVEVIKKLTK